MHLPDPLLAVEGSAAKISSIDSPDTGQIVYTVTYLDIFWTVLSIIMRLVNVVLNICLANEYYSKNEFNYFAWTTCCIIIPTLVTTFICIHMFVQDRKTSFRKQYTPSEMVLYVVILPFLFRYWQSLSYAIASKSAEKKGDRENQKKFYRYMIEEESDIALIRIFECFLEAAPQKILQISIILAEGIPMTWIQFSAISGSVCSSAYCMAQYHKYNRFIQPDKEQISLIGLIVQCIWHFLITVSRVLCIAVVASAFPLWTLVGFLVRVFITSFILQFFDKPVFCSSTIFHSYAFSFLLGIVYIFTYIIPKEGRTRYRFAVYYVVCVIENIAFVTLYIIFEKSAVKDSIYFVPLCMFSISSYFFGISFMILYYTKCHPNITSRTSLSNHEA